MRIRHVLPVFLLGIMSLVTSCANHPHFENSGDALKACYANLEKLRSTKDADIQRVVDFTNNWQELQDSSYAAFSRDSTARLHSPVALAFFSIADSTRIELSRLAFSEPRSLRDVMYLKLNTAKDRDKITNSKEWKEAVDFYNDLDDKKETMGLSQTIAGYNALLDHASNFKTEGEMKKFISQEDVFYRSLMDKLNAVSQQDLENLTQKTQIMFDNFYQRVGHKADAVNDRTMFILTMRFNRRIIQNVIACREDILNNKKLDKMQRANYRWMIIQPFLTLDEYSCAMLTDDQRKILLQISDELPELLNRIDDKNNNKNNAEMISKVLTNYFLKSYITTTF